MGGQTVSFRLENEGTGMKKAIVTGASGLLGRAILKTFETDPEWEVTGLAKTRARGRLICHDLLDAVATGELLRRERPAVVIHSAAERKPDLCEGQPELTHALNVTATATLCKAAREAGAWVLFISTDYVFDGSRPPYLPTDTPHPLNAYGESKLGGEEATLRAHPGNAALRVPILYGEVERLEESAVTAIACSLLDSAPAKMDHWAVRRPTLVDDVAMLGVDWPVGELKSPVALDYDRDGCHDTIEDDDDDGDGVNDIVDDCAFAPSARAMACKYGDKRDGEAAVA